MGSRGHSSSPVFSFCCMGDISGCLGSRKGISLEFYSLFGGYDARHAFTQREEVCVTIGNETK